MLAKILCTCFLSLIVYYGHFYRSLNYDLIPIFSYVSDERTNVAHGLSIRSTGVPAAWSDLRSYWEIWGKGGKEKLGFSRFNITISDEQPQLISRNFENLELITREFDFGQGKFQTVIVQPYLDHPPLGAIVLSLATPGNVQEFQQLTPFEFRKTSLFLGVLTTVLIFLFGLQLFNSKCIGLISSGVYASAPTFLITSRMALLENVLVPIMLIVLNLYLFAQRHRSNTKIFNTLLVVMGTFAGAAILTKIVGFGIVIVILILLSAQKLSVRQYCLFLIPATFVGSIYLVWGMFLSPSLFLSILNEQSTRRIFTGSLNALTSFVKFGLEGFPLDGWWIGSFITIFFLKLNAQTKPLIISFVVMLFLILFTGASSFAWYYLPLVPFLCINVGYFLYNFVVNPSFSAVLVLFFLFFSSSYFWGYSVRSAAPSFNSHQLQFVLYKIMITLFFAAAFLMPKLIEKSEKYRKMWIIGSSLLLLILLKLNFSSITFILQNWGKLNTFIANWQF